MCEATGSEGLTGTEGSNGRVPEAARRQVEQHFRPPGEKAPRIRFRKGRGEVVRLPEELVQGGVPATLAAPGMLREPARMRLRLEAVLVCRNRDARTVQVGQRHASFQVSGIGERFLSGGNEKCPSGPHPFDTRDTLYVTRYRTNYNGLNKSLNLHVPIPAVELVRFCKAATEINLCIR